MSNFQTGKPTVRVLFCLITAFLILTSLAAVYPTSLVLIENPLRLGDFPVFKAAAHIISSNVDSVYDVKTLNVQIHDIARKRSFENDLYWRYPPTFLIFVQWLAPLGYVTAALLWSFANLLVFTSGLYLLLERDRLSIVVLVSPSVLGVILMGQTGFLFAGILAIGLAFWERRPRISGLAFGCLCFKPHLAVVVPLYLIAMQKWRVIVYAIFSILLLVALSIFIYGISPWHEFGHAVWDTVTHHTGWADRMAARNIAVFVSVREMIGGERAWFVFAGVVPLVAAAVWTAARYRADRITATLLIAGGTTLLSPKFMDYDAVIWLLPMALIAQRGFRDGFRVIDAVVVGGLWCIIPMVRFIHADSGVQIGTFIGCGLFMYGAMRAVKSVLDVNR